MSGTCDSIYIAAVFVHKISMICMFSNGLLVYSVSVSFMLKVLRYNRVYYHSPVATLYQEHMATLYACVNTGIIISSRYYAHAYPYKRATR